MSHLDEFVHNLPNGVNTIVGERGVKLSGGQRQRIGLARSLYNDPQILVLDEATSALDSNTENEVMNAIRALKGTKTILIIAHRTSTIMHCDMVFEIKNGCISKSGIPSSFSF
jgi:ABC-type multidrug transport system fused ATPase/permease subunit